MTLRRVWSRAALARHKRAGTFALVVAVAWCACAVRAPVSLTSRAEFPSAQPAALAHLLADFSTHPHQGAWHVEEERGNYTEWQYLVSFACGARCTGRARVHAAALVTPRAAPQHGRAALHAVRLHLQACTTLPLLPWPHMCDELEVQWAVAGAAQAAGAVLEEHARAWCAAPRVLAGACARDLRTHRDKHLATLRASLPQLV